MIDIEVRIENVYEDPLESSPDAARWKAVEDDLSEQAGGSVKVEVDPKRPHIATVTLDLSVPDIPDYFASHEEWDEWAEKMIFPFTGIGKNEGDTGYFAEIIDAPEEYEHAVGKYFEWGI